MHAEIDALTRLCNAYRAERDALQAEADSLRAALEHSRDTADALRDSRDIAERRLLEARENAHVTRTTILRARYSR